MLPRKVCVDGTDYAVEKMPRTKEFAAYQGLFYGKGEGAKILIHLCRSDRQQGLTLLHEVIHAVLAPLKLNSKHEERIVLRLEVGLTSVLESNPTTFRNLITLLRSTRS